MFDAPGRKEAARARALRWMALELDTGVRHLVLDRRQDAQNAADRRVLGGLAGRPPRFTLEHRSSADEPLLWLADIVELLDDGADLTSRREFRGHATAGAILADPDGRILHIRHLAPDRWLPPGMPPTFQCFPRTDDGQVTVAP